MSALEPLPRDNYFGRDVPENWDRVGALRLASMIESYWRERGGIVNTRIVNRGFHPITRGARYEVLTDMVNGKPNPDAVKLTNGPVEVKFEREDTY